MNTLVAGIPQTRVSNYIDTTHALSSKSSRFQNFTYSNCETVWSYFGKINLITRNLMNASARNIHILAIAGKNYVCTIRNITTHMKLFALASVIFSWNDVSSVAKKVFNGITHKDREGIILGSISFTVIAADIIDSLTTFWNSASTILTTQPIALFSAIGLPLAYTMSTLGAVSRTIQIAKAHSLYSQINQQILSKKSLDKNHMKEFLETVLGKNEEMKSLLNLKPEQLTSEKRKRLEILKEKSKATILRSAPAAAVKDLEQLLNYFENTTNEVFSKEHMETIVKSLENVQLELKKKMKNDALGLFASVLSFTAATLFLLGSVSFWPFLILATAFSIRLASVIYQNQKLQKNILGTL